MPNSWRTEKIPCPRATTKNTGFVLGEQMLSIVENETAIKMNGSTPVKKLGSDAEFARMRAWLDDCIARGKKKKFSDIVTITPVLATLMMERNPINRPLNKRSTNEIKQDLANGKFVFNGQPIIIS